MLKNKSILLPKAKEDGIRICVMGSIHEEYEFDMWWPILAPSRRLVEAYVINKTMEWTEFKKEYENEQKANKVESTIVNLTDLVKKCEKKKINVTLLCGEEDYYGCHRQLIVEKCLKIDPNFSLDSNH